MAKASLVGEKGGGECFWSLGNTLPHFYISANETLQGERGWNIVITEVAFSLKKLSYADKTGKEQQWAHY